MKTTIADKTLNAASEKVRTRHKEHGDTELSFKMIADLWTAYALNALEINENKLLPHDVAQMMSLLKKGRAMFGNADDHFIDDAGYTAIAAMLKEKDGD